MTPGSRVILDTVSSTPMMEPLINLRIIFLLNEEPFIMSCSLVFDITRSRSEVLTVSSCINNKSKKKTKMMQKKKEKENMELISRKT